MDQAEIDKDESWWQREYLLVAAPTKAQRPNRL